MDWQVGDLALCVRAGRIETRGFVFFGRGLNAGKVYTVRGYLIDEDGDRVLLLEGFNDDVGRLADRFIKVTPPSADEFDREIIQLMNGKTVKENN